jgi:anthranilate phosphoribosyltransferase
MQILEAIEKTGQRQHLNRAEARAVMERLLSGSVPDAEIVAFLAALRDKGEQPEELVGFAEVMRDHAAEGLLQAGVDPEALRSAAPLLDTCGTGGDGHGTFNVSTAAALVAAAGGIRVAKHGNRSISSRCGSADVLESLGVAIDLPRAQIPACLEEVGMVFLFAPSLHLAMKHVMNARRSLKTKSVFNLLGPLTNPLRASVQLVGVYDASRTEMMARALGAVGTQRAFVVRDAGGVRSGAGFARGASWRGCGEQRAVVAMRPRRRARSTPQRGARQRCGGFCRGGKGSRLRRGSREGRRSH